MGVQVREGEMGEGAQCGATGTLNSAGHKSEGFEWV